MDDGRLLKMLILPIKRKWFYMIRSGAKKEEYRDIKHYYTVRFRNLFTLRHIPDEEFVDSVRELESGLPFHNVVLRAGYSSLAPAIMIKGSLHIGTGWPEWGAREGKEYYVLRIDSVEDLLTDDWKGEMS